MDPNSLGIDPHLAYFMPFFAIAGLIGIAIIIVPAWIVCRKAGFTPWLSLLVFIPFGAIILGYILAFARWRVVPAPDYPYPQAYPPAYPPAAPPPSNPGNPYPRA